MGSNIHEFFGFPVKSHSDEALAYRSRELCPFVDGACVKHIQLDDTRRISGVCSIKPLTSPSVVTCPQRMYADDYRILQDVAKMAFGSQIRMVRGDRVSEENSDGDFVAVFGKRWGRELRLPMRKGKGSYFVNWMPFILPLAV